MRAIDRDIIGNENIEFLLYSFIVLKKKKGIGSAGAIGQH